MGIRILGTSHELTLIFDRLSVRLSTEQIERLSRKLSEVDGVESVHPRTAWFSSPRISVVFDTGTQPNEILRRMALALRSPTDSPKPSSSESFAAGSPDFDVSEVSHRDPSKTIEARSSVRPAVRTLGRRFSARRRMRELGYGVLTLASFGMSWVGLLVPGIPTAPFVLLTAHFALQSSPELRAWVMKSKVFGQMIRDWQMYGAVRRSVQIKAYLLTLFIIVVGLIFSPPIPLIYAGMAFGSVLGLYAVAQIPVIETADDGAEVIKTGWLLNNSMATA
jgi:uncharacterized protein